MGLFLPLLAPFLLILARISAFLAAAPLFGWRALPVIVRAGMAILITVFHATVLPRPVLAGAETTMVGLAVLMVRELLFGLALGLAANMIFISVQQGAKIMARQMGFAEAGIIDPAMGEQSESLGMFFQMTFVLFFLTAGGHHLLLRIISGSYTAFPVGAAPDASMMVEGLVATGSAMLLFALKLAAPVLAAFMVLGVVLGVLARVLPEMNVLVESFPLRVGLGLLMAAAVFPSLSLFTTELADWMSRYLIT